MNKFGILIIWLLLSVLSLSETAHSQATNMKLLGDFEKGWQENWTHRDISDKPTKYEVSTVDDSNLVLQGTSIESASAMWRSLNIRPGKKGKLSWRWKIEDALSKDTKQKSKTGDDYAARLYVVFEPHMTSWKTRAICYVWAANTNIGSMYRSPYAKSVGIVVVESGNKNRDKWVLHERNLIADYRKIFGKTPAAISAIAIMVDTDNSDQDTVAWFDDINLEISAPEKESAPPPKPPVHPSN